MPEESSGRKSGGMDLATLAGVVVALGAILGGLVLEGGKLADIAQLTAAMIVGGGTLGRAVTHPPSASSAPCWASFR